MLIQRFPARRGRRRAFPISHLTRVRNKPHMNVVVLCKPLENRQHLAHVLRLIHVRGPLMVQLVIWINNESTDPVSVRQRRYSGCHRRSLRNLQVHTRGGNTPENCCAGEVDDPLYAGQLVILQCGCC